MRMLALGAAVLSAALTFAACSQQEIVDDTPTHSQQEILDEATGNYDDAETADSEFSVTAENFYTESNPSLETQSRFAYYDSLPEEERDEALRARLAEIRSQN